VVGDRIAILEFLNKAMLIDHNAIDGAPMARVMAVLSKWMMSGYRLETRTFVKTEEHDSEFL